MIQIWVNNSQGRWMFYDRIWTSERQNFNRISVNKTFKPKVVDMKNLNLIQSAGLEITHNIYFPDDIFSPSSWDTCQIYKQRRNVTLTE